MSQGSSPSPFTAPSARDSDSNGSLLQDRWTFLEDSGAFDRSLTGSTAASTPLPPTLDSSSRLARHVSPAFLSPFTLASPKHDEHRAIAEDPDGQKKGTQLSAIVNLLATAMGAGLLSLPRAFAHCGVVTGVVLLLMCGWGADISLQFLVMCSRASGRGSFEGNAQHYLGVWGRRAINTFLILLLFFASVAMVVIVSQLLPAFLQEVTGQQSSLFVQPLFVTALGLAAMLPICLKEDITMLRYTSALALINLSYYFTCLQIRFWGRSGPLVNETTKLYSSDVFDVLQGFSIMVAAFICHFNVFKIDFELAKPAKPYVWRCIHIAIPGVATTIYIIGGLLGYLLFGEAVKNNLLEEFHNDQLMSVARLALSLTNLFKLPLIIQPLRQSLEEALPASSPKCKFLETCALLCVSFGTAMLLRSLSKALAILGCTAGMAIAFVLPGLMRIQYGKQIQDGRLILNASFRQLSQRETRTLNSPLGRCAAWGLILFGSVFSVGALIGILLSLGKP